MRTIVELPASTGPYRIDVVAPDPRTSRDAWIAELSARHAGDGCRFREVARSTLTARDGWPATVRRVEILDGDVIVERRLVVIYEFVHLAGAVVLRGPRDAVFDEDWIRPLLESARPDFSGPIVALADLWR